MPSDTKKERAKKLGGPKKPSRRLKKLAAERHKKATRSASSVKTKKFKTKGKKRGK